MGDLDRIIQIQREMREHESAEARRKAREAIGRAQAQVHFSLASASLQVALLHPDPAMSATAFRDYVRHMDAGMLAPLAATRKALGAGE